MSTLTVTLPEGTSTVDGKQLTFVAPCDCTGVSAIYNVFERGIG